MAMVFFNAILAGIEKVLLQKVGEAVISKVSESIANNALNAANNVMDYEDIVRNLKYNLMSLSAKASDVENQIKNAERSGNKKMKREVVEWLRRVKSIETDWGTDTEPQGLIMRRLEDGGKAEQLNQQVEKLSEQHRYFNQLVLDVRERVAIPTTKMYGKAFRANFEKIWRLVEMGEVSRIAILGMGGVGKTALAEHINNRLVEQWEGDVFFVTVSEVITMRSLQDKIAHSVGVEPLLDEDDFKIRAGKLKAALSKLRNSFLILDDVWQYIDLSKLGCLVSKECCRLIITTRSDKVCKRMGCKGDEKIEVQLLDEDEAWELFSATLEQERALSPEVEEKARYVAKLCEGLPLAIITLAASMRGEESMHTWRDAEDKLKECEVGGSKEVYNVLKYSFDRLKKDNESEGSGFNSFQLCFLYCSLYPEDCRIDREDLVEKLVVEGLVERRSRRDEADQVHVIVDELVSVCLLERCIGGYGTECVKMHDLMRGMALKITNGKYMVRAGSMSMKDIPMERNWTENLEKVSFMCSGIREIYVTRPPNCPNLSTLILQENEYLEFINESFFRRMQGLRTLDLSSTGIYELPKSILKLKSLEALLLAWCQKLQHVPNVRQLKALRELDLKGTAITEVPQGVEELLNLKVLSLEFTEVDVLPRGLLLKLLGLQILRLPCHVQVAIGEIQNLKQLEEFRGRLQSVGDFKTFITSRWHDHTMYKIVVVCDYHFEIGDDDHSIEDFISCDKALILKKCNLENENALDSDIEGLTVKMCEGLSRCLLDDSSRWKTFKSLKKLNIESCRGIEFILGSEQAKPAASLFSTLDEFVLYDLEDLQGLVETGGASTGPVQVTFSTLTYLLASHCVKMKRLGLPLSAFPKLQSLSVWDCGEIEEIFKEEIGGASVAPPQPLFSFSLTKLEIYKCNKVKKLGISVLEVPNLLQIGITECLEIEEIFEDHQGTSFGVVLPKLKELTLKSLPRLKSVYNGPIVCSSIQRISILKCPGLTKKLPLHFDDPPPQSLKEIDVEREWWGSLEWDNSNLPALLQPFLKAQI